MNSRRLMITLYAVLFGGMTVTAGSLFIEAQSEYEELKQAEAKGKLQLAEAKAQLAKQTEILRRLREDRGFVEDVIRQRLNYGMPGEEIFRFNSPE